jgi:hypothetical protein
MEPNTPSSTNLGWKDRGTQFYHKYSAYTPAAFFFGGFILDLLTLGRIDDSSNWIMQLIYLSLSGSLLVWLYLKPEIPESVLQTKWKKFIFEYRTEAMHFCLGALLSVYTIFYFKSSSLVSSFVFILIMTALLVANEFEYVKKKGFFLKFALFALCVISFLAYIVPIIVGTIGTWVFVLSFILSVLFFTGLFFLLRKWGADNISLINHYFRPVSFVLILFLVLYLFRVLPPVPLSLQYIGAYHEVRKENGQYFLKHEREFWRVWNNGDQIFRAQPGDKIYIFFELFSPSNFTEQVGLEWYLKNPKSGWEYQDRIPIQVRGGRDEGFRGFGFKSNFQEGDWRVLVTTSDGREIGRMHLEVIPDVGSEREWKEDVH